MSLLQTLQSVYLREGLNKTYWVAYSGGLDSHVLLHLFAELRSIHPSINLRAIHVNHGLSPNAEVWSVHCASVCDALQVEYVQETIDATASLGESPEDAARRGRYAVFSSLMGLDDLLFTAHHQDDQAETMLLQLFRGAGPKGLSAMPHSKPLGLGKLVRPLLGHARAELKTYAEDSQLNWIEDESNTNIHFSRNFIRHHVMPVLKQHWPSIGTTVTRSAANCAEAQQVLDELAEEDLINAQGPREEMLSVAALQALNPKRQRQLLRLWFKKLGFFVPGLVKIKQIQKDMLYSSSDKRPHFAWKSVQVRRYQDFLYAMPDLPLHNKDQEFNWNFTSSLQLSNLGELSAKPTIEGGFSIKENTDVIVRFRRGGEICKLPGRDFTHSLKKLFQDWRIPYWERDRIPLLYVGEELAAVIGYFIGEAFRAEKGEAGYELIFTPFLPSIS